MIIVSPDASGPLDGFLLRVAGAMLDIEAGFRRTAPDAPATPWPVLESAGATFTWRARRGWLFAATPGGAAGLAAALVPVLDAAAAARSAAGERWLRPVADGVAVATPPITLTTTAKDSPGARAAAVRAAARPTRQPRGGPGRPGVRLLHVMSVDCRCRAREAATAVPVDAYFEWHVLECSAATRKGAWDDIDVEIAFASVVAIDAQVRQPVAAPAADTRVALPRGISMVVDFDFAAIALAGDVLDFASAPQTAALAEGLRDGCPLALAVGPQTAAVAIVPAVYGAWDADDTHDTHNTHDTHDTHGAHVARGARRAADQSAARAAPPPAPQPIGSVCAACGVPPRAAIWAARMGDIDFRTPTLLCVVCASDARASGTVAPDDPLRTQAVRLTELAAGYGKCGDNVAARLLALAALAGAHATRLALAGGGTAYEFAGAGFATFIAINHPIDVLDHVVAARVAAGAVAIAGVTVFERKK